MQQIMSPMQAILFELTFIDIFIYFLDNIFTKYIIKYTIKRINNF